jgi:hypothetical protein
LKKKQYFLIFFRIKAPQVTVKKDLKYLGIIRANPVEYVQRYGSSLKQANELPDFVLEIQPPAGIVLAADYKYNQVHELEGELQALKLVDLDKEGLGQYREQLVRMGISKPISFSSMGSVNNNSYASHSTSAAASASASTTLGPSSFVPITSTTQAPLGSNITDISNLLGEIFAKVDRDGNGSLTFEEAEKLLVKLNSRLGRRHGHDDVRAFFETLSVNNDGTISLNEFRRAFDRLS